MLYLRWRFDSSDPLVFLMKKGLRKMGNLKISFKNNYDNHELGSCDNSTVFVLTQEDDKTLEQRTVYMKTTLLDKHDDNICIDLNTGEPAYFTPASLVFLAKETFCYMKMI